MSDPLRGGSSAGGKVPGPPGPVDVKISASRVTKYQPCTIDLRPARVVHYPDLNACLVNERQSNGGNHKHEDNVDCRAVHFGYAIPVSVVPLTSRPELAELVLDSKAELSPAATSYLLQHHPQLRGNEMQTQAAPQQDDEDIAAIAKQISDHAEAIYQTWKSRGLAPAELRSVSSSAAPSFAPVLSSPHRHKHEPTPKPAINKTSKPVIVSPKPVLSPKPVSPKPHTVDLMNPSQLELLVNSFVEEDKARQARGSSIQTAVRKFDQQAALNNITPAAVSTKVPKKATTFNSFPQENNVSGLTTWPLKNHVHKQPQQPQEVIKNELPSVQQQQFSPVRPSSPLSNKYATLPAKHKENNAVFLEEVAREEERLINALKTGCVVEPNKRNKLSDDEMSGLSRVDYAKIRYHAAQQNPLTRQRLEDAREIENSVQQQQQHSAVSEARSRFEAPSAVEAWKPAAEWVPGKYQVDGTGALAPELPNMPISSQRRASKASVPHPELTSQQRQHIRERAGPPSSAVLNPVRPFLTRGSVAERVLIFEKCPPAAESLLLEKRPAITTWRTGNEVHCKTQVNIAPVDRRQLGSFIR
ncbi:hypothetical protein B566_EDAN014301 [Ephemera danica]|nr:hypothetical protein B566_EDAN014301 [Ephemera danica]